MKAAILTRMKNDLKSTQLVRKLVELSKEDGIVTESKVAEVLEALKQVQYSKPLKVLKLYLSYIRREIASQTAVVSTPTDLDEVSLKSIETHFIKQYNRPIKVEPQKDESLIAGIRVRVGDDVYDASVAGRLKRLAENVY